MPSQRNRIKKCRIRNCKGKFWAKGACRNHYYQKVTTGSYKYKMSRNKGKICKALNCHEEAVSKYYCNKHYRRYLNHGKSNIIKPCPSGKFNSQWKGGIAEYPEHRKLQKIRLTKLKEIGYKCEICGKKTNEVHHKDKSKNNHSLDNLMVACHKCHLSIFHKQPRTKSKFISLYGKTIHEIRKILKCNWNRLNYLHNTNKLKKLLSAQLL